MGGEKVFVVSRRPVRNALLDDFVIIGHKTVPNEKSPIHALFPDGSALGRIRGTLTELTQPGGIYVCRFGVWEYSIMCVDWRAHPGFITAIETKELTDYLSATPDVAA